MAQAQAEAEDSSRNPIEFIQDHSDRLTGELSEYSYLISDALISILIGLVAVFILHKLASRFIYPFVRNPRLMRVIFGTLYVLVFVLTGISVLKQAGFDLGASGSVAVLAVLFLAVAVYFIIPFLPKLPFIPGHVVQAHGVTGTVDAVSSFHTTIRTFDGNLVFIPNAMIVATKIMNFSYTPHRRIEIPLRVKPDSDLDAAKAQLLAVATSNTKVQADPAPAVFATGADASGVELIMYCWVENADFLGARSDLWQEILQVVGPGSALALSLPVQDIHISGSSQLATTDSDLPPESAAATQGAATNNSSPQSAL